MRAVQELLCARDYAWWAIQLAALVVEPEIEQMQFEDWCNAQLTLLAIRQRTAHLC